MTRAAPSAWLKLERADSSRDHAQSRRLTTVVILLSRLLHPHRHKMPARTLRGVGDPIPHLIPTISKVFDQIQGSTAYHQKNFVELYKLHVEASQHTERAHGGRGVKLTGERIFEEAFQHMLLLVLPLKKGITPADRVVQFVGGYTKFVNEKGKTSCYCITINKCVTCSSSCRRKGGRTG